VSRSRAVLILGGAGFLGRPIARQFTEAGWRVTILDRSFTAEDLPHTARFVQGDLSDLDRCLSLLNECDTVVHLIHTTVPGSSMNSIERDIQENIVPTVHLLSSLEPGWIRQFIYISSGGQVYGRARQLPIDEDHPTHPVSSYGVTKLSIEKYVAIFAEIKRYKYRILRPANAYGPGQNLTRNQGAVGVFADHIRCNQPIHLWGNDQVIRDYIHVEDIASAVVAAAEWEGSDAIWNVGTERGTSLVELIGLLENTIGEKAKIVLEPERVVDVPANILSINRIHSAIGWSHKTELAAGIAQLYNVNSKIDRKKIAPGEY